MRRIAVKQLVQDRGAAAVGHELALVADQPAGRAMEHQPQAAAAGGAHLDQIGFALGELLHHDAGEFLVDVDHHLFDRLQELAGFRIALEQHLGPRDRELEAFPPHGGNLDRVLVLGFRDLEGHIALGLAEQAVANHAAGDLAALGAGERGIVDPERHGQRGRIHRLGGQGIRHFGVADGVGHGGLGQARDGHDVARERFLDRLPLEPAEGQHLGDAAFLDQLAIAIQHLDALVGLDGARGDAAGDDPAEIRIGFQDGAQEPQRAGLDRGGFHMADHQVEQRRHGDLGALGALRHPAFLGGAVEDREIELLFARIERGEQVEHLVGDLRGPRVRPVDLVDGHDRAQPDLERLRHHELGLRQRAFGGIHQHDGAVHHVEDALDLAAEIGVPGGVHDIDAGAVPGQRGDLRQDGDPALALEIVGIHGALGHPLVVPEGAGLLQQPVHQGGLAVIDVRDDGNVAKLHDQASKTNCGPLGPAAPRI